MIVRRRVDVAGNAVSAAAVVDTVGFAVEGKHLGWPADDTAVAIAVAVADAVVADERHRWLL